jgi:hypothetical protein
VGRETTNNKERIMSGKQWAILIGSTVVAGAGVFVGAGADASWADLSAPQYVLGSVMSVASAVVAFFSKGPQLKQ